MKFKSWLWPDRTIGKRESRVLREEHNALLNEAANIVAVLQTMTNVINVKEPDAILVFAAIEKARAALAKWEGGAK